jgi:hypothetical protein
MVLSVKITWEMKHKIGSASAKSTTYTAGRELQQVFYVRLLMMFLGTTINF